jgi:hypothetical protein
MSRKNKRRKSSNSSPKIAAKPPQATSGPLTTPQVAEKEQTTPAVQATPLQVVTKEPTPKTSRLPIVISALSLIVALCSAYFAMSQLQINRHNQDRASGRIRANFDFDEMGYKAPSFIKKTEFRGEIFRLDNIDELIRWQPRLTIKNTGGELIDSIKVQVSWLAGEAYGPGVKQIEPAPFKYNQPCSRELSLPGKLIPHQKATVFLAPMLLDQMLQSRLEQYPDQDRHDIFNVEFYCRIVGATSYDSMEPHKSVKIIFDWKQSWFSDDKKCQEFIAKQPIVNLSS